jgi:hypothetical protein
MALRFSVRPGSAEVPSGRTRYRSIHSLSGKFEVAAKSAA